MIALPVNGTRAQKRSQNTGIIISWPRLSGFITGLLREGALLRLCSLSTAVLLSWCVGSPVTAFTRNKMAMYVSSTVV